MDDPVEVAVETFLRVDGQLRVIAHRGLSAVAPENTLPAFRRAIAAGAVMLELDVAASRDHELVVMHDERVERTTDGQGAVAELSFAELAELDAGVWFGAEYAGTRVPRLGEVLELARGRCLVNVEIKAEALRSRRGSGFVESVVAQIEAQRMTAAVLLSSFDPRALQQARDCAPGLATAVLHDAETASIEASLGLVESLGARALHLADHEFEIGVIERCHRRGWPVYVYTVNTLARARQLAALGVDGVFSDNADVLLSG